MPDSPDPLKPSRPTAVPASPPIPKSRPKQQTNRSAARPGMNKTGARILGGFAAALISWIWSGWFEPWTGVAMGDAMLTSLGGAMIVISEFVLVKEGSR